MPHTLLLADDSVTIQRVIELTFADEGVHVIAVSDGDAAIACLEQDPPDIVLADVGMPGKSGYDVARHIKQSARLAHIPVVLLTGAFEPVDQRRAAEAGCDGVLAKPFEPQLVIGRVKELLRGVPERPARKQPTPPAEKKEDDDRWDLTIADAPAEEPPVAELPAAAAPVVAAAADASEETRPAARVPALADAFSAFLAAEQPGGPPIDPSAWRTPAASTMTDELVDRVALKVLERLSDQVVRETVADLVSSVAERLVREEIEKIKGAIK